MKPIPSHIRPYVDVAVFFLTMMVANCCWKCCVTGEECGEEVLLLGWDVSEPFRVMTYHVASVVYGLVALFRDTVHLINGHIIHFHSGSGITIVWGCTGIKQAFIWLCIMLTVIGGWKHKLWFIPMGWVFCYVFNILRLFLLAILVEFHPTWFSFLHEVLFKYLYYAMMFGLWLWFVEKFRGNGLFSGTTNAAESSPITEE